jgi:hypothetical protein
LEKWVTSSPAILSEAGVAETLGMPELAAAQASAAEEEAERGPEEPRALPATQNEEPEPEGVPNGLTAAAELLVFDALSRAGGRLLTRENRGQFVSTPKHELHTVVAAAGRDDLLDGSFQFVEPVADAFGISPGLLRMLLTEYTRALLNEGAPHDRARLRARLPLALTGVHR